MAEENLKNYLDLAVKNLKLSDYKIIDIQQGSKEDGYGSDISFVKISAKEESGTEKVIHLVIKAAKKVAKFRDTCPLNEVFRKEIYIYTKVKETFENFQNEYGIQKPLDFLADCYATQTEEPNEALVLENLKTKGYRLLNKKQPWTWPETQLSLKTYGHLHALSFALKHKKPEEFEELTKNNVNMFSEIVKMSKLTETMGGEFIKQRDRALGEDAEGVSKYLNYKLEDIEYALTDMFFENLENRVILHGDCWSNNFLFKHKDGTPISMYILDWQCSGFGSPVFDLSHNIYATANTAEHQDIHEYLQIYYKSLSDTLHSFNCDSNKIYTYGQLVSDWKQFSRFGLFLSAFFKKVCFVESEDNPDLDKVQEGDDVRDMYSFSVKDDDCYQQIKSNFLHYCKNVQ